MWPDVNEPPPSLWPPAIAFGVIVAVMVIAALVK